MALDLLRLTEKSRSLALPLPGHQKWRKACINIWKHILKFSNCVLSSLEEECTSGEYIFLFCIWKKNYIYNYYKKSAEIYICQIIRIRIRNAWEVLQPARKLKLKELDNCQVPAAASAQSSNTQIFCMSLVLHLQLHPKHPHPTSVPSPTVPTSRNTAECWATVSQLPAAVE